MIITHDDLAVCIDCAMILANGELGLGDDAADAAHAALISAQWPDGGLVLSCPDDCEESFSWSRCDGCGSALGGGRHSAVVLGTDTTEV